MKNSELFGRGIFLVTCTISLIFSCYSFGATPAWVKMATKNIALDQFVTWMAHAEFYQIKKITTQDLVDSPNPDTTRVQFIFQDHLGCMNRTLTADCFPLSLAELFCSVRLTHCDRSLTDFSVAKNYSYMEF